MKIHRTRKILPIHFTIKCIVLKQLGRYEQAVECFDQAISNKQQFFYEPWYSRGILLNYLKRYNEAIDCFDQAIKHYSDAPHVADENVLFDLHVARGQAKYNIGDGIGALEDFKEVGDEKITDRRKSQRYNNIGIYYHQDGEYKKAQSKYEDAITKDPTSIDAHYNLAILHINKNEIKEVKKSLDKCLEIETAEREQKAAARKAKQKLDHSGRLDLHDWYGWWFGHSVGKAVLGIVLITVLVVIASPLILMPFMVIDPAIFSGNVTSLQTIINTGVTAQTIAGLTLIVGVIVGILLLPSLQKFKLGSFEFDSLPPTAKHPVDLDPISQIPSPPGSVYALQIPTSIFHYAAKIPKPYETTTSNANRSCPNAETCHTVTSRQRYSRIKIEVRMVRMVRIICPKVFGTI